MLEKKWRFIDTGSNNGFLNMAIDEAILEAHIKGIVPPTLRVYRWNPPALSIGCHQNLEKDVLPQRCFQLGIDIVRRITGGRAVFHDNELTYSIVVSERYGIHKSIADAYTFLNNGLVAAFRDIGMEVYLVPSDESFSSPACFASTGMADLTFQGRKIAGSAQLRRGDSLLQHGSLPISLDTKLYISLLKLPSEHIRKRVLTSVRQKTTSIGEVLNNKEFDWQILKEALFKGFQNSLGIKLHEDKLTIEELDLSNKLAREKYSTPSWNYHREYITSKAN